MPGIRIGRRRELRVTATRVALFAFMALLLVPAAGSARPASSSNAQATCQLSVFSWWTGGGEAAGLDKLIKIWNKANPTCKVKNEAVAGGAGSNAKAVLQSGSRPAIRPTRSRGTPAPSFATTSRPVRWCRSTSSTRSTALTR